VRDIERLREKIELSLDDRQVIALSLCALLLLGGVFSLGILLGKKISSSRTASPTAGDLATLDAQARKPDPSPAPLRASPHPETAAKTLPAVPVARAHDVVETPEPVRAASIVPPPQKTTLVSRPSSPPVQVRPAMPLALTPPPHDLGDFTVQVGASQDRGEAARMEARARGAGLKPYVVEASLGAKGTWYRVRVGAFRDKEAAGRFRLDVERELRSAAAVMSTH
jgi:DedD protein